MKRNVCGWVVKLLGLLLLVPQLLMAQEEGTRDVAPIVTMSSEGSLSFPSIAPVLPAFEPAIPSGGFLFSSSVILPAPSYTRPQLSVSQWNFTSDKFFSMVDRTPTFQGDYSTGSILWQFRTGMLVAFGSQSSLPGLGHTNEASFGYYQFISPKLELQFDVNAMTANLFHINSQMFGVEGIMLYHVYNWLILKVFGSYALGDTYGIPTRSYGATLSVDMSDCFGVEAGVRRYYNPLRGGWQTVPIVAPYYRFDKTKLQLDVGGILYQMLHKVVVKDGGMGNPTIAPSIE